MSAPSRSGPRPLAGVVLGALLGGALAGAGAGAIDALWSWGDASQFLDGGGKLRLLVYLAALYGLSWAALAVGGSLVWSFYSRLTRLGDLLRAGADAHQRARERDPRTALAGLSLVIAGAPTLLVVGRFAFLWADGALAHRKHLGLIIGAAMAIAVAALAVIALLTFALARPIELGLAALARSPAVARALSSPLAPAIAAGLLVAGGGAVAAAMAWDTLSLLPLRPLWIALVALALLAPAIRAGAAAADSLATMAPAARRGIVTAGLVATAVIVLIAGARVGVVKAADRYSGLGGPLTRTLQRAGDFDGDGFSRILAGGDCDDGNDQIHPGAVEIPGDGIDQNCLGGDPTLSRDASEVAFAELPESVPKPLNVVLITIDTLRADHVSAYGYRRPTTPRIDAVASSGTLFRNAWAHAPSTRYSMPAILTGRLPLDVVYDTSVRGWPGLSEDNTTIAEIMKSRGMATGAVLNYWYFTPARKINQGYDHYDNRNQRLHKGIPGEGPAKTKGSSSKEQTDHAIEMLDKLAGRPFHLWVHYYDPHFAYEKHPEATDFGNDRVDLYDNEIQYTDLQIGRLLDELERRGLYDRTVVVITGDHGEGFGEHGIDLHGYHLYSAQTKVPLIIRVPGVAARAVDTPVGHVDILPTLANLVGGEASPEMMGRSLVDMITGAAPASSERYVFQQLSYENNHEMRAAVGPRCHAIFNVSPQTSWEIYRIESDPDETRDIVDDPGDCADTRRALEAWYDRSQIPPGAADALLPGRPELASPLGVRFGDEVELLAVDLPDQPIGRGHSFPVTFTFAAHGPLRGGWKLFAHFEGRGQRFQGDHTPVRPFDWWRDGQFIRYTHQVRVPPHMKPGNYRLWMGLFRGADRRPARAGDSVRIVDDRVLVGSVRVK
jgi:arylsulfatase A-like enzyme